MSTSSSATADLQQASRPEAKEQERSATATSMSGPFQAEEKSQIGDCRSDSDDEDGRYDGDAEDEPEYNWVPNGSEFLNRIGKELDSASPAPVNLSFSEHQQYWKAKFDALVQKISNDGTADTQLTEPPIKPFEIEILDYRNLDEHGCGLHCPCDLDSTRNVEHKVFILSHESGLTHKIFLEQLRDILHSQEGQAQYSVAQDVLAGKLSVKGFNWMMSSGEIWNAGREGKDSGQALPCVYVEVDGTRKQAERQPREH